MMSNRARNIRKRIAKRKKTYDRYREKHSWQDPFIEEQLNSEDSIYDSENDDSFHPLWNREIFLLKVLTSAVLVLIVAIIFKSPSPAFHDARNVVEKALGQEFQFAAVADWYEGTFGKPLALLPEGANEEPNEFVKELNYALPVSGKVSSEFEKDGRGVMIETENGAAVEAMSGGVVIFAGKKEDIGQTVIIQHADLSETWYGKLDRITVKPHEHIEAGKTVGTVSSKEDELHGEFYLAINKEGEFIDPNQVINLE